MKTIMRIISPVLTSQLNSNHSHKEDTEYTSIIVYQLRIRKIDGEDKTWLISLLILVNLYFLIDLLCWLLNLHERVGKYLRKNKNYCLTELVDYDDYMEIEDLSSKYFKKKVTSDSKIEGITYYLDDIFSEDETKVRERTGFITKRGLTYNKDEPLNMFRGKKISLAKNELESITRNFDFEKLIKLWKEKERK